MCTDKRGETGNPVVLNTHDITAKRGEWHVTPPRVVGNMLRRVIKEERDMPICYLFVNIMCSTLPAAAAVFYFESNWLGFAYFLR